MRETTRVDGDDATNLLHDTRLALRECDMATRLIGDELDLDLSALTSGLVIIIVIVVSSGGTLAFDAATVRVAISNGVVVEGRGGTFVGIGDIGHCIELSFGGMTRMSPLRWAPVTLLLMGLRSSVVGRKYLVASNWIGIGVYGASRVK